MKNARSAMHAIAMSGTATPTPIFAPFESPEDESELALPGATVVRDGTNDDIPVRRVV
jgi:hypothetical protein